MNKVCFIGNLASDVYFQREYEKISVNEFPSKT